MSRETGNSQENESETRSSLKCKECGMIFEDDGGCCPYCDSDTECITLKGSVSENIDKEMPDINHLQKQWAIIVSNIKKKLNAEVAKLLVDYMPSGWDGWKEIVIERELFEKLVQKFDKDFNINEHYRKKGSWAENE